ncbi:MAG: DJ-1/PfpI family protein [Pseudomonadota bacterium]
MYGIMIYDGVEPIDIGATFGVLSMARRMCPGLQFAGVAQNKGVVRCANGLEVIAQYGFKDAPDFDDLIVTGGPGWRDAAADAETLAYLRSSPSRLTAICTGAMILAASGRLHDRRATTKSEVFDGEVSPLAELSKTLHTTRAAVVDDRDIVTSGGVTLGIDAVFYCLARSHGQAVADETARVMEYQRALRVNKEELGYG